MTYPIPICQHVDVIWLNTHLCRCKHCGKLGHWYEDGFVFWTRRPRKAQVA